VIYNGGSATIITQTTTNGSFFLTAFGINDSGRIVGQGIDPQNAARNVGLFMILGRAWPSKLAHCQATTERSLSVVSNSGYVVGSSMQNQGSGLPFIWSEANGMVAIPLAPDTSLGQAEGVNSLGWVVGTDGGAFAVPFLYDGTNTYRLQDLIPGNSGWDLSMNTSSSAEAISENIITLWAQVFTMAPLTRMPWCRSHPHPHPRYT
jgi:hypothetical protein